MTEVDPMLTAAEVARELRCSKAHVYKLLRGQVTGVTTIPSIPMGRRVTIRRSALESWKRTNEASFPIER